jgi:hypothetical protein
MSGCLRGMTGAITNEKDARLWESIGERDEEFVYEQVMSSSEEARQQIAAIKRMQLTRVKESC